MNVFLRGYKYYKKETVWYVLMFVLMISFVACGMLIPQATQLVIDNVFSPLFTGEPAKESSSIFYGLIKGCDPTDYKSILTILSFLIAGLCLATYVLHYTRWNMTHAASIFSADRNRNVAFAHMLDQSPLVLSKYNSGELLQILHSDVDSFRMLVTHWVPFIIDLIVRILLSIYFIMRMDWFLILPPVVVSAFVFVVTLHYKKQIRKMHMAVRETKVDLNTCVQENINGVRIVRSFASEEQEISKFTKKNDQLRDKRLDANKYAAKYGMIFSFAATFVNIACVIFGIIVVMQPNSTMGVGEFSAFITYASNINVSVIGIANNIGASQESIVLAHKEFDFIDEQIQVENSSKKLPVPEKPTIIFDHVSMVMDGRVALDDVSFTVPYGTKVGFMGQTGSGKSVIMKLLCRLYDCTDGRILLDGVDIKDYDIDSVRKEMSYVMQDVFLFSDTVEKNIALVDDGNIDEEKLKKASSAACVDKFVPKLTDGYQTIIGERGFGLSGGQKQRASIARALYKNAPIMLLDDYTSALDYATEQEIVANIDKEYSGKTMLIATHRANSAAICDEIIYLEKGKIIEQGKREELLAKKGKYYEVVKSQESVSEEEGVL